MNFKIIETNANHPDILVSRSRNEDTEEEEVVIISTFGCQGDVHDLYVIEEVKFSEPTSAKRFVRDFTVESANEWCKENNVSY